MKLIIDDREGERINFAKKYYGKNNPDLEISVEQLDVGDYLFINDNDERVCFEYKSMEDFFNSINDNRIFNQTISMFELYDANQFVLLEGNDNDRKKLMKKYFMLSKRGKGKSISNDEFFGTIARINTYSNIIRVAPKIIKRKDKIKYSHDNAFFMMFKQAEKCFSNKLLVKKYNKSTGNVAFRFLVYVIDGVGPKTAKLIVDKLGVETFNDLLSIGYDDLISIKGVGPKTAKLIVSQIGVRNKKYDNGDVDYFVYELRKIIKEDGFDGDVDIVYDDDEIIFKVNDNQSLNSKDQIFLASKFMNHMEGFCNDNGLWDLFMDSYILIR